MFSTRLPSTDFQPRRFCPDGAGNWSGHLPFARDLVEWLRPTCIVELGVRFGESYFGLCQSAQEACVDCRAWAVDTWAGDLHTGAYGEEVYDQVEAHNRAHYSDFSTLIRLTFDEASVRFPPRSIDLLHIDGLHTYEAVRHDFETWLPMLSPGAVVLFHDIAVRKADFGVWRFWDELSALYPAFSFTHSHGLGVLLSSAPLPSHPIAQALFSGRDLPGLRAHYEICAERLKLRFALHNCTAGRRDSILQLFWREAGKSFSEARSRRIRFVAVPEETRVTLPGPPPDAAPAEMRLDLSVRPVLLHLRRLALLDRFDRPLWEMAMNRLPEDAAFDGMRFAVEEDGLLCNVLHDGAKLVPRLSEDILARFADGGSLSVSLFRYAPLIPFRRWERPWTDCRSATGRSRN